VCERLGARRSLLDNFKREELNVCRYTMVMRRRRRRRRVRRMRKM
jgi:hypothetical protein